MKEIDSKMYQTHYRTQSIHSLYDLFCALHPLPRKIGLSSFSNFLPSWLRLRHKYTGLCKTCYIAYFYAKQLRTFRKDWHKNCTCTCTLCTTCNHGLNFNFDCNLGKCMSCCSPHFVKCPMEWNNKKKIIYNLIDFVTPTGTGTGNRQKIITHEKSINHFVKFWYSILVPYVIHANHVDFHKCMLLQLAEHKDYTIARLHIDFIQNLTISTHDTIQSQHFASKQITLLVITVQW